MSPRALNAKVMAIVDTPTKRRLERLAKANERSVGSIVRLAIRDYLAKIDEGEKAA